VDYLLGRTDVVNYTPATDIGDDKYMGTVIENTRKLNEAGMEELVKYSEYLLSKDEYIKSRQEGTAI
jgi:hypothetical protein